MTFHIVLEKKILARLHIFTYSLYRTCHPGRRLNTLYSIQSLHEPENLLKLVLWITTGRPDGSPISSRLRTWPTFRPDTDPTAGKSKPCACIIMSARI